MARFINLTDEDITELIAGSRLALSAQGEHDQGDVVLLDWDATSDLQTIASTLWEARNRMLSLPPFGTPIEREGWQVIVDNAERLAALDESTLVTSIVQLASRLLSASAPTMGTPIPHDWLPAHCSVCGDRWPRRFDVMTQRQITDPAVTQCPSCHAGLPCRADTTDTVAPDPPCMGSRRWNVARP
jgi:hypothetical protein